jgi:hypothetical protein
VKWGKSNFIHLIELRKLIGFLLLTDEKHAMWFGMSANALQIKLTLRSRLLMSALDRICQGQR